MSTNILIVGDIVNTKNNSSFIDSKLERIIKEQDFSICNFEAPVEGKGLKYLKVGPTISQKRNTIEIQELLQYRTKTSIRCCDARSFHFGVYGSGWFRKVIPCSGIAISAGMHLLEKKRDCILWSDKCNSTAYESYRNVVS